MRTIAPNQLIEMDSSSLPGAGSRCGQHVFVRDGRPIPQGGGDRVCDRIDEAWIIKIQWVYSDADNRAVVPSS